jgi:hypothetical protein
VPVRLGVRKRPNYSTERSYLGSYQWRGEQWQSQRSPSNGDVHAKTQSRGTALQGWLINGTRWGRRASFIRLTRRYAEWDACQIERWRKVHSNARTHVMGEATRRTLLTRTPNWNRAHSNPVSRRSRQEWQVHFSIARRCILILSSVELNATACRGIGRLCRYLRCEQACGRRADATAVCACRAQGFSGCVDVLPASAEAKS